MSVFYWDYIWLGSIVLVLTVTAVIATWKRDAPSEFEPVEPVRLSAAEREVFRQEKAAIMRKAAQAKRDAKRTIKARRQELAKSRQQAAEQQAVQQEAIESRAADTAGPGGTGPRDVKS